ncbi:MAG: hypothetical protein D6800_02685, partial [Candidatus Zixiibacteriota bacterium]
AEAVSVIDVDSDASDDLTRILEAGRYVRLLKQGEDTGLTPEPEHLSAAWKALEENMALVPSGEVVPACGAHADTEGVLVPALYIDRYAVTNEQFAAFVADGGYNNTDLWPEEAWAYLPQFVDQFGYPAPRYWQRGLPPADRLDHPVTGICWYEAKAYALWAGKRLPTSVEWERAGTWPTNLDEGRFGLKYPWGNSFSPDRANLWSTGIFKTVPVTEFPLGAAPNGVYQLIGNVWEWVDEEYAGPAVRDGLKIALPQRMAEVRGGAFDTYFETQATCRFRTGKPRLFRGPNVGFRCVVSAGELRDYDA